MVRAHQVADDGWRYLPVSPDKGVYTVFTAALYSMGAGANQGAVLHFKEAGVEPEPNVGRGEYAKPS